jgi:glycosyltransferase involved in cell wall biosynthesis
MKKKEPKVSAVMCTYKRFKCVERAVNMFIAQTYQNKELIIFNTDAENPYLDDKCQLMPHGVLIINCNTDFETKQPYTNVGAIRRDALRFAGGDYVITFDDDDIFLPFFIEQAIDRMQETGMPSFKPEQSFFNSGNHLRLVMNTLEASIIADIKLVRKYGYLLETGKEGLGWYTKMRDNNELDEHDKRYVPSYCFNWNDGQEMNAPHKQSGDIDNPNNFENHKAASIDPCLSEIKLYDTKEMDSIYYPYYAYLYANVDDYPNDLVAKYLYEKSQPM